MVCCICVGNGAGTQEELQGLKSSSKSVHQALLNQGIKSKIVLIKDRDIKIPKCDFVFNLCDNDEGHPDSFINFTEYLENHNISFTGSSSETFKLHYDKYNWSSYSQITPRAPQRGTTFSFKNCFKPVIVKHRYNHGSLQFIKTYSNLLHFEIFNQLKTKNYFWEQFIKGKELTVACLPDNTFFISERKQDTTTIIDFHNKWHFSSALVIPALTKNVAESIEQMIVDVRSAFKITSYMRLDLRMDTTGKIYLIDINPNCSIDPNGTFCRTLRLYNITYEKVIHMIYSKVV